MWDILEQTPTTVELRAPRMTLSRNTGVYSTIIYIMNTMMAAHLYVEYTGEKRALHTGINNWIRSIKSSTPLWLLGGDDSTGSSLQFHRTSTCTRILSTGTWYPGTRLLNRTIVRYLVPGTRYTRYLIKWSNCWAIIKTNTVKLHIGTRYLKSDFLK